MSQIPDMNQVWTPPEGSPMVGDTMLAAAGAVHGELPELRLRPAGGDRRTNREPIPGVEALTPEEQIALVNPSALAARERLELPEAERAVVVLIDGFGWHNLHARADLAPFLTGAMHSRMAASAQPSTTAANITYVGTGVGPGQTAMAGYTVRNPTTNKQVNLISWTGLPDATEWQRVPTIFERLAADGVPSAHVNTWRFEHSGMTQAAHRGATYIYAEGLDARVDTTARVIESGEYPLVYTYWPDLDTRAHEFGWQTREWEAELRYLDTEMERFARILPPGTLMIVTADHGMADVPPTQSKTYGGPSRFDIAEVATLREGVDLVAGENRFVHLYTREPEAVAARWRDYFGERVIVKTREQAFLEGVFGTVRADVAGVIGDVTVAVLGDLSIGDSRIMSEAMQNLLGLHGSVTEIERAVPILTLLT